MNGPSDMIIVDAAILISAVCGRGIGAIKNVDQYVSLVTSARAVEETRRRIEFGLKQPDLLAVLDILMAGIQVVQMDQLALLLPDAERTLKRAVASNNGSTKDAHLVALAWAIDADVWTTDRDFAGTGIASWSTPNLLLALNA